MGLHVNANRFVHPEKNTISDLHELIHRSETVRSTNQGFPSTLGTLAYVPDCYNRHTGGDLVGLHMEANRFVHTEKKYDFTPSRVDLQVQDCSSSPS